MISLVGRVPHVDKPARHVSTDRANRLRDHLAEHPRGLPRDEAAHPLGDSPATVSRAELADIKSGWWFSSLSVGAGARPTRRPHRDHFHRLSRTPCGRGFGLLVGGGLGHVTVVVLSVSASGCTLKPSTGRRARWAS